MMILTKIRNLDNGEERELFNLECEEDGVITYVTGCIYREYRETWGGSYLMDREILSTCISKYIEIFDIVSFQDGEEIAKYKPEQIEKLLNGQNDLQVAC